MLCAVSRGITVMPPKKCAQTESDSMVVTPTKTSPNAACPSQSPLPRLPCPQPPVIKTHNPHGSQASAHRQQLSENHNTSHDLTPYTSRISAPTQRCPHKAHTCVAGGRMQAGWLFLSAVPTCTAASSRPVTAATAEGGSSSWKRRPSPSSCRASKG